MSKLVQKAREFAQLGLMFTGFLAGIALVVTCGGGGGGVQGGGSSTASTISFIPLDFGSITGGNGMQINIDVPPVLRNTTNVQDALNRLNVVMSPELSRLSDPLSSIFVPDSQLPQIIIDPSDGVPITFSRKLAGLVRASNLSGPLRADNAFFLSCDEQQDVNTQPLVARTSCLDDPIGAGRNGVFELFTEQSIMSQPLLATATQGRLPDAVSRVRLDGFDSSMMLFDSAGTRTVRITGNGGPVGVESGSIAANGSITSGNAITAANDVTSTSGNVNASVNVSAGVDVTAGNDVVATNDVNAGADVNATNDVTAGATVSGTDLTATNNVAAGATVSGNDVTAANDVAAANDVSAGNDVTAENQVVAANSGGVASVTLDGVTGDVTATGNIMGSTVAANAVSATATIMAGGDITSTGGNIAAAAGNVTASGTVMGADVSATNDVTAGNDVVATTGDVTAGDEMRAANDITTLNGDFIATNGSVIAGNTMTAANDITSTTGSVVSTAGVVQAGGIPLSGVQGAQLNSDGRVIAAAATVAAQILGNIDGTGAQILEVLDRSMGPMGGHVLIRAGEKGGAAPDGTGFFQIFDSAQMPRIVLDGETGEITADILNVTTAMFPNSQVMNLTVEQVFTAGLAAPFVTIDGNTGDVAADGTVSAAVNSTAAGNVVAGSGGGTPITLDGATGNVNASGNVNATGDVSGATATITGTATAMDVVGTNSVSANSGGADSVVLNGTNGDVTATGDVTADNVSANTVTATTGDVAATAGNVTAAAMVSAGTDVMAGMNVIAMGNVTAGGQIIADDGMGNPVTIDGTNGAVTGENLNANQMIQAGTGGNQVTLDGTAGTISSGASITAGTTVNATTSVVAGTEVTAGTNVRALAGSVQVERAGNVISLMNEDGTNPGHGLAEVRASDGVTPFVSIRRSATGATDDGLIQVYQNGAVLGTIDGGNGMITGLTKAFVQPHPEDPSQEIVYTCLEGPENGLYARGTARLEDGQVYVTVPESFRLAAAAESLTVQLTPLGDCMGLFAPRAELTRDGFRVKELYQGRSNVEFSWQINGVRRGMETYEPFRDAEFFKPVFRDSAFLAARPGLQKILIDTGVLNADGTPNPATFRALGWELKDREELELAPKNR